MGKYIVERDPKNGHPGAELGNPSDEGVYRVGRIARVVRVLFGPKRGGVEDVEEAKDGTPENGKTTEALDETPEERETRLCRERLWKAALLALLDKEEDRHKLIDGDSSVLLLAQKRHYVAKQSDVSNGVDMTVDPVFLAADDMSPIDLVAIIIDTELFAVSRGSRGRQRVRVKLVSDPIDESSVEVIDDSSAQSVGLRPAYALMVVSQLAHNFGVRRLDVEAL